jgi:D-threo-aldose 1-dehydrogenase
MARVQLPSLGFGAAPIGDLFEKMSEADVQATLQAAWGHGIRLYDTSPFYGFGLSEVRLGYFLRQQPRDEFLISTKVGRVLRPRRADSPPPVDNPFVGGLPFDLTFDYRYDGVMRSYEDSLCRLGLNRVDILFVHDLDRCFHKTNEGIAARMKELESGWKALDGLRSSGEIQAVGVGINDSSMMLPMMERFDPDLLLVASPYNLIDQKTLDREFPQCRERGVQVIIGAPFASGILATGTVPGAKYLYEAAPADVLEKVRKIEAVCDQHDVSLKAAALQFTLAHDVVSANIPGAMKPSHVDQNVAATQMKIPAAFWAQLKEQKLIRADAPVPAG